MNTKPKQFAWLMGLLVMIAGLGCASSYHRYSDCCGVSCGYCEPAPLPYQHAPGCTCHSKPGRRYLSARPVRMTRTGTDSAEAIATEERESPPTIEEPVAPVEIERSIDVSRRPYDD